jgi:hypothetical protein
MMRATRLKKSDPFLCCMTPRYQQVFFVGKIGNKNSALSFNRSYKLYLKETLMTTISSLTAKNYEAQGLDQLRDRVSGQVVTPNDEGYDVARLFARSKIDNRQV